MLDYLGFPRTTWSSYENGVSQPDIDGILRIASFFGISATDLLKRNLCEDDSLLSESEESRENEPLPGKVKEVRYVTEREIGLLREIIQVKQQVIDTQAQTIGALQALVKHLHADLT